MRKLSVAYRVWRGKRSEFPSDQRKLWKEYREMVCPKVGLPGGTWQAFVCKAIGHMRSGYITDDQL